MERSTCDVPWPRSEPRLFWRWAKSWGLSLGGVGGGLSALRGETGEFLAVVKSRWAIREELRGGWLPELASFCNGRCSGVEGRWMTEASSSLFLGSCPKSLVATAISSWGLASFDWVLSV